MLFLPFYEGVAPPALPVEGATPVIAGGGTHEIIKDFLGRLIERRDLLTEVSEMNVVVLAKQVPDAEAAIEIKGDGAKLEIEQKFATSIFDEFALEEALRIRERLGGRVMVITLGAGKATEVLRTGIAMGADAALLLENAAFLDGDGYSTALALSKAVAKEPYDIVLCGRQAVDDDRGEVGPMVAQFLGLPSRRRSREARYRRREGGCRIAHGKREGSHRGFPARSHYRTERSQPAARSADHGCHEGDEGPDTEDRAGRPGAGERCGGPRRVEGEGKTLPCPEEKAAR